MAKRKVCAICVMVTVVVVFDYAINLIVAISNLELNLKS